LDLKIKDLTKIPGVGKSIAQDLIDLGINQIADLKQQNPDQMYQQLCRLRGCHIDRCVLYVFRCAVYFASEQEHDQEMLKWWNWKDK
jgi:hypothetical protein